MRQRPLELVCGSDDGAGLLSHQVGGRGRARFGFRSERVWGEQVIVRWLAQSRGRARQVGKVVALAGSPQEPCAGQVSGQGEHETAGGRPSSSMLR